MPHLKHHPDSISTWEERGTFEFEKQERAESGEKTVEEIFKRAETGNSEREEEAGQPEVVEESNAEESWSILPYSSFKDVEKERENHPGFQEVLYKDKSKGL